MYIRSLNFTAQADSHISWAGFTVLLAGDEYPRRVINIRLEGIDRGHRQDRVGYIENVFRNHLIVPKSQVNRVGSSRIYDDLRKTDGVIY